MAEDINTGVVTGHLVEDGALSTTRSGLDILKFSVAFEKRRKDGDKFISETEYLDDLAIFGPRAKAIAGFFRKGLRITVAYKLDIERWEKDNLKHKRIVLDVVDVSF